MGFGDEIMATAEAWRLKEAAPHATIVIGDGAREVWGDETEAIFAGNPHVSRLAQIRPGADVVWLRNYYGHRPYLDYQRGARGRRQAFASYRVAVGELFFSVAERAAATATAQAVRRDGRPLLSIEPHVAFSPNKDWGLANWQALVDALRGEVVCLQPSYGKPLLSGVHGIASSFRAFAAVLAQCDAHVGPEGGLHHAAAAVGCPAVVLFGGRISPDLTGYAAHENVYVDRPGSPCGMVAACAHCQACWAEIEVEMVVAAVRHQLAAGRRGRSLTATAAARAAPPPPAPSSGDDAAQSRSG
jgi:hypothetical protein